MTRLDHIDLYRKRASELESLAAETRFEGMRGAYRHLAEEWNLLADSLERQAIAAGLEPPERSKASH